MEGILRQAVERGASDVHIVIGLSPMVRIHGELVPLDTPPLSPAEAQALVYSILSGKQQQQFEEQRELDCSYAIPGCARFRVNVLMHNRGVGAVLRIIGARVPTVEEIDLSPAMVELCHVPRGLVLVTGGTGSGKSTTLAAMVQVINASHSYHIITIEDPIEFVYEPVRCIITQREVGHQTNNFQNALRAAMRQDPDVILVGEMRDLETISLALTAAETGHLVLGTLHTTDVTQTIDRIVDVFPPFQQQQIRTQLAGVLRGVICQTLLPRADGHGRVAARELLLATSAVGNIIREGKTHQLYTVIETGGKLGMISLDRALANLVRDNKIRMEDALAKANDVEVMKKYLGAPKSATGAPGGMASPPMPTPAGWR